jgi:hypothetical protein
MTRGHTTGDVVIGFQLATVKIEHTIGKADVMSVPGDKRKGWVVL